MIDKDILYKLLAENLKVKVTNKKVCKPETDDYRSYDVIKTIVVLTFDGKLLCSNASEMRIK